MALSPKIQGHQYFMLIGFTWIYGIGLLLQAVPIDFASPPTRLASRFCADGVGMFWRRYERQWLGIDLSCARSSGQHYFWTVFQVQSFNIAMLA